MVLQLQKVLISDEVDPKCVDILRTNGIEVVKDTSLSKKPDQLITEIKKYDGLIVRSATKVTANVISAADNLKIIGRAGTGVDNIDCAAATKKGIIVMNTPGGNTLSAAELTCTLLLTISRHVGQGMESMHAGRWDRKKFMGCEVNGKTLAIIGLGRIGEKVAERMQAFGMTTVGYDPIIPAEVSAKFGVEWLPLEKLWPVADYITVHTPLIPQTRNLINDDVFSKCKKGVRVINCARGGIIDEDALLRALESGQCGGAGLDVFVEEPPSNSALIQHPLVTCTPHLGASTVEAQSRVAEEIAQQFVDAVQGRSLFGAINAHSLVNALSPDTKKWIELGSALGKLTFSYFSKLNYQQKIDIKVKGSRLKNAGSYLSAAVLTGLLNASSQTPVNMVSAPAVAKEKGIQVSSCYEGDHTTECLVLTAGDWSLEGTVGYDQPLLTNIGGKNLAQAVHLSGNLLIYNGQAGINTVNSITGAVASCGSSLLSLTCSSDKESSWVIVSTSLPLSTAQGLEVNAKKVFSVEL